LTAYNDQEVTFDSQGRLVNDGSWEYSWTHGRQLASITGEFNTWNFTYDANGMRIQRTGNNKTYQYVYDGSQLRQMTVSGHTLYFTYDASGTPLSVTYDGTTYYYLTNLQGDVIAILSGSGQTVVTYGYDAWGNPISFSGMTVPGLRELNPLRYRGYVYDEETGLYYLQSRYYNPAWGRFISADAYISTGQGVLGHNMFAYCNDNPINYIDPTGNFSWLFATIVIGIVLLIPSDNNQVPKYEAAASQKYNENTISMRENELGDDPDKLNVTFYPEAGLIHIEQSYTISSEYEKRAVISVIMNSEYYDPSVYGNSVETMLIEWSGHNFVYHTASSSVVMYRLYQKLGYETPIESTQGVDFRKQLDPATERNYKLVTLWGILQW